MSPVAAPRSTFTGAHCSKAPVACLPARPALTARRVRAVHGFRISISNEQDFAPLHLHPQTLAIDCQLRAIREQIVGFLLVDLHCGGVQLHLKQLQHSPREDPLRCWSLAASLCHAGLGEVS